MNGHFAPGSLVSARGREWVVLPSEEPEVLRLRPLTSAQEDEIGLFLPLEQAAVRPAQFAPPDPRLVGDATGVMTLFDAARLSLRSGAAPFRSLGRISVAPRPYQFVPLIMALRLDPVRLLIADDVGIGKTIEAGMVARELLDRGIARRLGVLCPAHLCDQWRQELAEKFALETALIQPAQFARLERELPRQDVSVYAHYPHLVASIDFVKSDRHREAFLPNAPDLVIVDEAHMAARPPAGGGKVEHQRHELLRALAADPARHLILVTATPHSGIEESFRSLLGLLNPAFGDTARPLDRKQLLPHLIQRRRRDVEKWLGADTPFPERKPEEVRYDLSADYRRLFNDVLEYCRETLEGASGLGAAQQRVRHWAAIALLRCLLSSPEAGAGVLARRADRLEVEDGGETAEAVDGTYRPQVSDAIGEEDASDYLPASLFQDERAQWSDSERRRLSDFVRRAQALSGPERDRKLFVAADALRRLLRAGHRPIVFCRFIQTATYLEEWLPEALGREFSGVEVRAVTGDVGDEERRERVQDLTGSERRILVATDCLSEGINLQEHFDAVLHYDLPWNPNRLEQREGRVDRFGQPREEVRTVLLYGADNPVDQVVLDVLIRKAQRIRRDLGVAVPVPIDGEQVLQTVVDNVLLRQGGRVAQLELALSTPDVSRLHGAWDKAAEREGKDRAYFAQAGIKPEEVDREIRATDGVLGEPGAVGRFLADALQRFNGRLEPLRGGAAWKLVPGDLKPKLAPVLGDKFPLQITFDRQKEPDGVYLGRTHPAVAMVCDSVLGRAFAPAPDDRFARAGAMRTDAVDRRTVLLLLRLRYRLREQMESFAEEIALAAFERKEGGPAWLEPLETAARSLAESARPVANIDPRERAEQVEWALAHLRERKDWFVPIVEWRKGELQAAHDRLRRLARAPEIEIEPHLPPDILGCFVLLPAGGRG